jgi:hypothetical protein
VIAFVKVKGNNLIILVKTLQSIINYEPLKPLGVYGTYFGHMLSKACQYVTKKNKVHVGLKHVRVQKMLKFVDG